jgi:hypothetical protein
MILWDFVLIKVFVTLVGERKRTEERAICTLFVKSGSDFAGFMRLEE